MQTGQRCLQGGLSSWRQLHRVRILDGLLAAPLVESQAELDLKLCCASKATNTLLRRIISLELFCVWLESRGCVLGDIGERIVSSYAEHLLATNAPPTRAQGFKEALFFIVGVFGFSGLQPALNSGRFKGAVFSWTARAPLAVATVKLLEGVLRDHAVVVLDDFSARVTPQDASLLGAFLFCLFGRFRFGDLMRVVVEPSLAAESRSAFIETTTVGRSTKTGRSVRKLTAVLPLVAPALGLLPGARWDDNFLSLRVSLGQNAAKDGCFFRRPSGGGLWSSGRLATSKANTLLQRIFAKLSLPTAGLGTHSAKHTSMAWINRAGLPETSRKLLGGHSCGRNKSMDTYNRDLLTEPLSAFVCILSDIRSGAVDPDDTGSGCWSLNPDAGPSKSSLRLLSIGALPVSGVSSSSNQAHEEGVGMEVLCARFNNSQLPAPPLLCRLRASCCTPPRTSCIAGAMEAYQLVTFRRTLPTFLSPTRNRLKLGCIAAGAVAFSGNIGDRDPSLCLVEKNGRCWPPGPKHVAPDPRTSFHSTCTS